MAMNTVAMDELPDWWNDLIGWFLTAGRRSLPRNMIHAWRVNRYADSVCNGGLAQFLSRKHSRISHDELKTSIEEVCEPSHRQTLDEALLFLKSKPRTRLTRAAQLARVIAYDGLFREWPVERVLASIAEICSDCPKHLYPAVIKAASKELDTLSGWEALDRRFYAEETRMRLCIAQFAQRHLSEWQL